jgi:hypothetical protein
MRHFIHYHNSDKMGYSASAIPTPRIFTKKSVQALPGSTVWLISGEGKKSPKFFFLGAAFVVHSISVGKYEHPDFKNSAHGKGLVFGETLPLSGLSWFEELKAEQLNFKGGLTEISNHCAVNELLNLSGWSPSCT